MTRREVLALAAGCACVGTAARAQHPMPRPGGSAPVDPGVPADITLRIGEITLDLGFRRSVRTLAYNGQVPGPALRATVGRPLTVDVWNDHREQDIVHWHGFHIPPEVDGAYELGTPGVPPRGRQRYIFTPEPAGTQWYHSHHPAGRDLKKGTYTGQFGLFVLEDGREPGRHDAEVPLLFHEWDPRFTQNGPLDIQFRYFSINGKMLGRASPSVCANRSACCSDSSTRAPR
jgi:FtsP/CotA-like multicopper oxidase with cupredoxin domain